MTLRRLPPLAVAFALMAAALVAALWATQKTANDAFAVADEGEAVKAEEAVRADLAGDFTGPPSTAELAALLHQHDAEGVRYIGLVDMRGRVIAEAGSPVGTSGARERKPIDLEHVGGRIHVEVRANFRRPWGEGSRAMSIVVEVEPMEAGELRAASHRTVAIGLVAALLLLGVAITLVRRELRRKNEDRARERERRLASLGEMSAVLAHEIKNPLASLKGNAQLLAAMLPDGEKPRAKADRVVDEAVRLEKLTEDLLAYVRTGQLERSNYDPAILARDAATAVKGDIAVDGAAKLWSLDGGRIREVLVNLIDNAISAGPPVHVRVAIEQGQLVYEISDKGPGVPAADRDKIFEPFHTGKTRGTGLGLAIAKRIVEQHRGQISVDDAPGGGAKFRIVIPEA